MTQPPAEVDFWLAGQLRIRRNGQVETLGRTLLHEVFALLLLRANTAVSVIEIITSIWPSPAQANERTVPPYITKVRTMLDGMDCLIESQRRRYILHVDPMRVDVLRFRQLAHEAETGDAQRRRELLDEAMRVCPQDTLLSGFPRDWAQTATTEHRAQWRVVAHQRNQSWLDAGDHERLLHVLRRERADQLDDQPLVEDYLITLYRSGYVAEALAHHAVVLQRLRQARVRIQQRLVRLGEQLESQDPSLERSSGPVRTRRPDMLPPLTGRIEGRQADLRAIERHSASRDTVRIVGIYGAPGIGKTALAVTFAHRHNAQYPDGVLFAHLGRARGPGADTGTVIESFLRALGVGGDNIPTDPAARMARYQELVRQRAILLVIDDAGSTEDVVPLLPTGPGSLVLVTSRNRLTALAARYSALSVVLGPVGHPASVEILNRLAGGRPDWSASAAAEIARTCGGHPLALCLAGARLATRPEESLTSLATALAEPGRRIPALDQYAETGEAVVDIIGWSYRLLPERHARVFRLLSGSVCPTLELGAAAQLVAMTEPQAREVLDDLFMAHLVTFSGDRYGMLDLVSEYAAALNAQHDDRADRVATVDRLYDYFRTRVRAAVSMLWPMEAPGESPAAYFDGTASARAWLDRHREDLLGAVRHPAAADRPGHVVELADRLFRYLDHGGFLDQAVALQRAAVDAARRLGDDATAARALVRLGAMLVRTGQLDQAQLVLQESHERYVLVGDSDGQATAMGNLGRLASRRGAYDEALAHHTSAAALFHASGQRLAEARTLTNLGVVHKLRGDPDAALRDLEEARAICGELDAGDAAARALGTTAGILRVLGRLDEAAQACREATERFLELGDRIGEAAILCVHGLVHSEQNHHPQAIALIEDALKILSEMGDDSGYVDALLDLGTVMLAAGRRFGAVRSHREALDRATALGSEGQLAHAHACLAADHAHPGPSDGAPDLVAARQHLVEALDRFQRLDIELPAAVAQLSARLATTDQTLLNHSQ